MTVQNLLNAALYARMNADSTLTAFLAGTTAIYFTQAPDNATLDFVVFSYQGGGDANISPLRMKNLVVNIRGLSSVGPAKAGSIDARIDTLLHMKPLTVAGWSNFWLAREQDFALVEVDASNKKTWTSGGLYRVMLDRN